jgi:cell division septal protein FtsQ
MVRRKRELSLGIAVLLLATLAFIFGWTNIFTVQGVSVNGSPNSQITNEVLRISGIKKGEKLARIEPRNISTNLALAGIDWIEKVNISRNWISRDVTINISARVPVAVFGNKFVDVSGVLFTSPVALKSELPTIDAKNETGRLAAVEFYQSLPIDIRKDVLVVSASSTKNFRLQLKNALHVNWRVFK